MYGRQCLSGSVNFFSGITNCNSFANSLDFLKQIIVFKSIQRRESFLARIVLKKFMLNSAEHEILNAHKYKNIKKISFFKVQINVKCYFSCS